MTIIDWVKGRKYVSFQEGKGFDLAIYIINEFKDRKFSFKGFRKKYSKIDGETLLTLVQRELDSALVIYRYTTKLKKYRDRKGVDQIEIKLVGRASMLSRYNPLDVEMNIITERM